jgi:DNA-binding NarL/FixJ family response regulator
MFILLVDNNRFFVSVLKVMLFKAGFNSIGIADCGHECLNQINKDESPDVVIIDESQCIIDSLDVIEIIHQSLPDTKFIIMTCQNSDLNINFLPEKGSVFLLDKSSITADNLPQILYNIFTEKISATRLPQSNKVFSSLRRSFTGMLNFGTF